MPEYGSMAPYVEDIDPALLAAQREMNQAMSGLPTPDLSQPGALEVLRGMTGNNPGATQLTPLVEQVDFGGQSVEVRVFVPENPRAVFVRIHGGGWAAGAACEDDVVNDQYAREIGVVVISPDYRLTPEFELADQIADCTTVVRWAAETSSARFGTDRMLIGGPSAGAHLAANVLLHLRANYPAVLTRIEAALLDCGPYDLGGTPSGHLFDNTPVLTSTFITALLGLSFPNMNTDDLRDPSRSPMFNDLAGLPPALFVVGDLDPLRDDTTLMAMRWLMAGNEAQLDVWPEAPHAFTCMGLPLAGPANARIVEWLSAILARPE